MLVLQDWPNRWGIDSTRFHGPNVVSCKIADHKDDVETGGRRWVGISSGGGGTRSTGGRPPHL